MARCNRVIFWDFDGTLGFRRDGMWSRAMYEIVVGMEPATDLTPESFRPYLREGFPWHQPEVPHPELDTAPRWWARVTPMFRRAYIALGISPDRAGVMADMVPTCYTDPTRWSLFPDTVPTLTYLASEGWSHAIISNHVPELPGIVEHLGLSPLLAGIFNSAALGYEKPNRHIFDLAIEALDRPRHAWMVGDNVTADVLGACAAGIPGILVRGFHPASLRCCPDLLAAGQCILENHRMGVAHDLPVAGSGYRWDAS
ncbi:MAG: HAD-IA family hydrolase [Bacillota bacterium]